MNSQCQQGGYEMEIKIGNGITLNIESTIPGDEKAAGENGLTFKGYCIETLYQHIEGLKSFNAGLCSRGITPCSSAAEQLLKNTERIESLIQTMVFVKLNAPN